MMDAIQHNKKVGGRKVLHSQSREIVANVYNFMKREAELGEALKIQQVQQRVAEATGLSLSSVKRVVKEQKTVVQSGTPFQTPNKIRKKKKFITDLDQFDLDVVRRTVNEFHQNYNERPAIKTLLPVLKDKINFKGSDWSLRHILKQLGFRWRKSENNRKILIEKSDIREKRITYLRKIKEYRDSGRPIIFMDESYVHSSHTKPMAWSDGSSKGLKQPVSKGKRIIIVHAGNENGFVKDALLTFISGRKTGDYHHDMNFKNYEKWIKEKLIPNIPEKSVIVIDNAPYHNVQLDPAPTSNSKKADMVNWLTMRNIRFTSKMLKPELYSTVKLHKPRFKQFKIDTILGGSGHSVLRLPPYHPDLNPIEMVWSLLKEKVAKLNTSFSLEEVKGLVEKICLEITPQQWKSRVEHSKKSEQAYLEMEPLIDEISERIVINLGEDSDSDEDDVSENEFSDDEHDISGISPLD